MRIAAIILAFAAALLPASALAQSFNVSLVTSAEDDVGRQIASVIRQKVAASPLMTYMADDTKASLRLRLTTLDPDGSSSQNMTVYSAVFVFHPTGDGLESYLSSSVGTCGRNRIEQCASTLFAKIDELSDTLRSAVQSRRN